MKSMMQKFRDAEKERHIVVDFEVYGIPVRLRNIDLMAIQEQIAITKILLIKKYTALGLDKVDANLTKWNQYLVDREKALKKQFAGKPNAKEKVKSILDEDALSAPKTEAERLAGEMSTIYAIQEIIPTFLIDPETDKRAFEPGSQDAKAFTKLMKNNTDLTGIITTKFTELQNKVDELGEAVKN